MNIIFNVFKESDQYFLNDQSQRFVLKNVKFKVSASFDETN